MTRNLVALRLATLNAWNAEVERARDAYEREAHCPRCGTPTAPLMTRRAGLICPDCKENDG